MKSYYAYKELIVDKLKTLTGVTVIEGWLIAYADELQRGVNGMSFPAVSATLDIDKVTQQRGSLNSVTNRTVSIVGAVSLINNKQNVIEKLEELLFNVKCAVADERKLTITDIKYMLPENRLDYAMFEIKAVINFNETWIQ